MSRVMMLFLLICCVEHQEQASGKGRWVLGYLNGAIAGEIILVQAFEGLRIGSGPKPISKAPLRSLNARLLLTAIAGRSLLMLTLDR
jgi:hypothetical protein